MNSLIHSTAAGIFFRRHPVWKLFGELALLLLFLGITSVVVGGFAYYAARLTLGTPLGEQMDTGGEVHRPERTDSALAQQGPP